MLGYVGRMLHIDLEQGTSSVHFFDEPFARKYLGANGFAARILYDRLKPGIEPCSPGNVVVFAVGPLTDSPVPCTSRGYVATKSPMNGLFFDSTFGGRFAVTQKRTGFEVITVSGRAEEPTYLRIDENGAELKPAGALWGRTTREAVERLQAIEGESADAIAIGPAGERQVRYACLSHFWRGREGLGGRGGVGAVLGSKNLKAVVVVRGSHKTQVADPTGLRALIDSRQEALEKGTAALKTFGTPVLVNMINTLGGLGVRNLQEEHSPRAAEISGETLKEHYFDRNETCFACPVGCGKTMRLPADQGGLRWKMPEYETLFSLGSMLDNWDPGSILLLNSLCDQLGLDTISMGVTLSFAFECFERGLLTTRDTGGRALRFGDAALIAELVQDTAERRGVGDLLAEGSYRLAERIGREARDFLYCFKKVEVAGHSARALKGMSIGYATATRGGSHHDARPTQQYMGAFDRTKPDQQPLFAVKTQNFTAMADSLTQCRFASERGYGGVINENYVQMINAVTGWTLTLDELERLGERIYNLERAFNCREGVRRTDDCLPIRTLKQPIAAGPSRGMYTPPAEFEAMLDEYYRLRGWGANGVPTADRLKALGLEDVIPDLAV